MIGKRLLHGGNHGSRFLLRAGYGDFATEQGGSIDARVALMKQ
ncbi:hypothetical protein [Oxalicibacterium flavum]|nr:hypothetical protein [Oxalicibacterium flavum]